MFGVVYGYKKSAYSRGTGVNLEKSKTLVVEGVHKEDVSNSKSTDTLTSSPQSSCEKLYACNKGRLGTDRWGNTMLLYAGHAICSHQYRFGVTHEGIFQWHDCDTDERKEIYSAPSNDNSAMTIYFIMSDTGTWQLINNRTNDVIWEKSPRKHIHITPYSQCLSTPKLDCPYLHLHSDGLIVLNSINHDTGEWVSRKSRKAYENLFP